MTELSGPESAVVRFRDRSGVVVGAGFLAGEGLVLSCAHVVAAALGRDEQQRPTEPVTVEFPPRGLHDPVRITATVAGWTPTRPDDRGDIAVLRLDGEVPAWARPARLSPAPAPAGGEAEALGFPDHLGGQGVWARGRIRREQTTGWLQIDSISGSDRIGPGYSGAPVFSEEARGVIGMVVAVVRDAGHTTTFLHPAHALIALHPELRDAQASPYRGLAPFAEQDAEFFRGRDELIADALGKSAVHPLVVLSGPSGSGKTSLAHAGLLPRLRAQGRTVVTARVLPDEPAATLLARILLRLTTTGVGPAGETSLAARIEAGADPARFVDDLSGRNGHVVVVDQFEEAEPATARTLVDQLYRLAETAGPRPDGAPRLLVVLTLRGRQLDAVATGETAAAMQAGLVLVAPMTAEQVRAAITAPGAAFERGLVERLVADAGVEPGSLPLLEFTLDRLWERRELGMLTNAGYDELGGVAGAVARYADRAYERDPARARRLLVLLAGPDDDGVFRRRPLRLADLPAGLRPALDRLVAARLVVAGPGAGGEPVAELAHEALIRAWPRLREWLEQDRDFRTWLEEVRRGARSWRAADREPDALLRGAALVTASQWTERRAPDLGRDEVAYVRESEAQERRRARRGRGVTAALVVLTLLAGLFALVARQQTGEVRRQLDTAASRQLADDADHFRATEPGQSLQLALAAWHADDRTAEAYGALFTQYVSLEPVDRIFTGVSGATNSSLTAVEAVSTSRDGSVAVVADGAGAGTVWRGLAAGEPERVTFGPAPRKYVGGTFRISPSGRLLAYANDLGGVYIRDLARPGLPPVDLAPTGPDRTAGPTTVQSLQFAPDDTGLAVLRTDFAGEQPELRVWDLRTRETVPDLPELPGGSVPSAVYFGPEPGSLVLSTFDLVASYDLGGRREPRFFRATGRGRLLVAGGGALVISCGSGDKVVVRDIGTARQVRSIPVKSCSSLEVDANCEFGIIAAGTGIAGATNASLVIVDPRTGDVRRRAVPPVDLAIGFAPIDRLAVYRAGGEPAALLAAGDDLYRLRLGPPVTLRSAESGALTIGRETVMTPDGAHRVVSETDGRITTVDARTGRQVATVAAKPKPSTRRFQGVRREFTDDSRRLITAHHGELVVYALPDLTVEHRRDLPVPPDLGPPPVADDISDDWAGSVVAVGASEAIILYAGMLTRWNLDTGTRLGEPVPLREGEDAAKRRRAAQLAFASGGRPGHPDQVTVVLPDATVRIWSLDQRRAVARFDVDTALTVDVTAFDADGSRLAVRRKDGATAVWRVDDPQGRPSIIPTAIAVDLLGFTPGAERYLLTTAASSPTVLEIWNLENAQRLATLTATIGSKLTLRGNELGIFDDGYARRLPLDPNVWLRTLCGLADRPYTADEITLLRNRGAQLTRPCASGRGS